MNPSITEAHFPSEKSKGKVATIELIHLNSSIASDEAVEELDAMGFRPATLRELLVFGAKYPEKQREFFIVALGSVWRGPSDTRFVAYLYKDGAERYVGIYWWDAGWGAFCRFAAVRKSQP